MSVCITAPALQPGLAFTHLSTAGSTPRADARRAQQNSNGRATQLGYASARGVPRGELCGSADECCSRCTATAGCRAFFYRSNEGLCFLGNCTARAGACMEYSSARASTHAGVLPQAKDETLVCAHPDASQGGQPSISLPSNTESAVAFSRLSTPDTSTANAGRTAGHFALLLLGHRSRLMFSTIPSMVVAPLVASNFNVHFFALLENSTMQKVFRNRHPVGDPDFAALSDEQLRSRIAERVAQAGGEIGEIRLSPRPAAAVPDGYAQRLWRYSAHVKGTVATRMLKEKLAMQMVLAHEARRGVRFSWVLWTREDSHWFAPLRMEPFAKRPNAAHGKLCGGFGGWNDKVWLMGREAFEPMFSMYDALHAPAISACVKFERAHDAETGGSSTRSSATSDVDSNGSADEKTVDFLASPSIEQFRERVGLLRRVAFVKHPPEALPTMDSYFAKDTALSQWKLCFPRIYARACVPKANRSSVERMYCD